ncbi:LuxR C-terminal-related transcriptional regulator [Pseudonocardia sp. DSM 110487]|uniref:helix-turn-helix transcriptional regulator n=1 Tax=Pseudonocardia sp. DSM 110487 TaxID=2865833 RepID=UPI001C694FA6|nr:LuxR family transcriptional regulator [Pseudonocardia sp. DSM 110487]QYN36698.1 LuxR C-terminal-related transcriptional regulator [Pseudonocardia sp. DSM 110487]
MAAVKSESAASDSALAGAPAARRLYREIASAPTTPRHTVVVGPGGSGKSVLLGVLGELYGAAGVSVRHEAPGPDEPFEPNVVLLLDDAHELDEVALQRVRAWAAQPESQVVLAHRPWPRGGPLASIVVAFGAGRGPVVLGPFDRPGVAARANLLLGERPTAELVDLVFEQTGGSPDLVDRLLVGLRDERALDRLGSAGEPPAAVVRQLGYEIDAQPVGVRELLLGRTVGAPLDPEVLGALLDVAPGAVGEVLDQAAATGLMTPDGEVVPLVRHALQRAVPAAHRLMVRRRLAEIQLDAGGSVLVAARGLIGSGATGTRVAAAFERAGDEALRECLPVAADLYDAAVEAGASPLPLSARRAEAALFAGDLDAALRRADQVLAEPAAVDGDAARRAVAVAAAVLAHRGMLSRGAELYRWLAAQPFGGPTLLAVPTLVGIGALDEAGEVMHAASGRAPTVLAGAEALLAQGIHDTVAGPRTAALSQLTRASVLLESSGRAALLPETPCALAALVAIHCGELDVAQSVLGQAVAAELGGPIFAARHLLLQALVAMHRGSSAHARALLQSASGAGRLEPRDELLAAALEVGLARRAGDLAGLLAGWRRAREAIVRHPVDLYSLQPLGELVVGAARLNEQGWVQPYLDEAEALLDRLGNPPLWAVALHWSGLQAAIGSDAGTVAQRHVAALDDMAPTSRYATAVAAAGREWLRSLAGDVDADAVEAAARGLHSAGLSWEGGRLASQAAIRCRDRKSMNALLGCARALQAGAEPVSSSAPTDVAPGRAQPVRRVKVPEQATESAAGSISGREREVAELVLSGLTYKQIGEQLFISAKTVENHVARMRQRLGSGSRGELFAHLRMLVGGGK